MYKEIKFASKKEVQKLLDREGAHISLCSAVPKNPAEPEKIRISLKNAISEALESLSKMQVENSDVLIKKLNSFTKDNEDNKIWKGARFPLLIIVGEGDFFEVYATSLSIPSGKGIVGRHPYLRPLCNDLNESYEYEVLLQLHKDSIDAYYLDERVGRKIDSLSASMEEVLAGYEKESTLQSHSTSNSNGASVGTGSKDSAFHGHGVASDKSWDKKKTTAFYQKWAELNHDKISELSGKTVLCGSSDIIAIFKSCSFANQFKIAPFTIPVAATGTFDECYDHFIENVSKENDLILKNDLVKIHNMPDSKRVTDAAEDIVKLLIMGQVDKLFINLENFEWNNPNLKNIISNVGPKLLENEDYETGDILSKLGLMNGSKVVYVTKEDLACNYLSTLRSDKSALKNYSEVSNTF